MPAPGDLFRIEWADDPVNRLSELRDARGMLDIWIEDAVKEARAAEVAWQAIGDGLGTTRAAAWERFHDLD